MIAPFMFSNHFSACFSRDLLRMYCLSLIVSDYPAKLSHPALQQQQVPAAHIPPHVMLPASIHPLCNLPPLPPPPPQVMHMLSVVAEYTAAPLPHMRAYACDIFKELFICLPSGLQPLIPQLIARFVQCCGDSSAEVRSRACE
jgi:hypothetical protein